jgi:hypothetical protein
MAGGGGVSMRGAADRAGGVPRWVSDDEIEAARPPGAGRFSVVRWGEDRGEGEVGVEQPASG